WVVTSAGEWEPLPVPPTGNPVGMDVGLKTLATMSAGQEIATPGFFGTEEKALGNSQRNPQVTLDAPKAPREAVPQRGKTEHPNLDNDGVWQAVSQDGEEQGAWKLRQKRRKVVARTHARARWKRDDFAHQHSRRIVNTVEVIVMEDLTITNMVQNGH